jgi:hypothetical protein
MLSRVAGMRQGDYSKPKGVDAKDAKKKENTLKK